MRSQSKADKSPPSGDQIDTDQDRFPTVKQALTAVIEDGNCPDYAVDLIEIRPGAGGEVAWRVRPARADETDVGLVQP